MIKHSVSFVIYDPDKEKVLAVFRGDSDKYLPNMWSLPSGYVDLGESLDDAAVRAALQKLGIMIVPVKILGSDSIERKDDTLQMTLFEAKIVSGTPSVPQPYPDVTQYDVCEMITPEKLIDAARKEVLSCKIFLDSIGYKI